MRLVGIVLWALGLILFLYAAFVFDPSIRTYSSYAPDRVVNLGRQQTQLLLAMAGLTQFLAGVIVHALSYFASPEADVSRIPRPTPPGSSRKASTSPANAELLAQHGIRPGGDGAQV